MEIYRKSFPQGEFITFSEPPEMELGQVEQVHGTKIVSPKLGKVKADGLYLLNFEKKDLVIITADCMPILLLGENGSALLHAGWRGLKAGILNDDKLDNLKVGHAFVGPHIKKCCYEVGKDFAGHFDKNFYKIRESKMFFSLAEAAKAQIKSIFGDIKIEEALECTCCYDVFHSYRRNKTTKRNWNVWKPNVIDTTHPGL